MMNNLKELRNKSNLKQIELAKITGISSQMISDYENNRSNMSISRLIILADYFKVSLDYLVGRKLKKGKNEYDTM